MNRIKARMNRIRAQVKVTACWRAEPTELDAVRWVVISSFIIYFQNIHL